MEFQQFVDQGHFWKAKRQDILQFWQSLHPNIPMNVEPINPDRKGTRFSSDGIRITGTAPFINSVLSRLKDFLRLEGPGTKLDVEYRQIENKDQQGPYAKPVYAFYIHVVRE
jgi:hypothetical protein